MQPSISQEPSSESSHRIDVTLSPKVNLADYQNAIPVLRELSFVNNGSEFLSQLDLTLQTSPSFVKAKTWRIESVAPGQQLRITDLDVALDGGLLSRLTEAQKATVVFTIVRRGDAIELAHLERQVELLPRNQWGGLSHLPDLIAAFVQPNEPAVERLLKRAANVLHANGKPSALNGYEEGAKRAWEIVSAVWSAIGAQTLDYSLPPASFEQTGQKIRGAAQIGESGLATCLDLALLFASVMEQAGLNPLLLFTTGHAFAGVWLKREEFSTTVVDDITALRKRIQLKELVLFETTGVTHRPPHSFARAIELGAQQVAEGKEASFQLAIDIRRARMQRIKPLASPDAAVHPGASSSAPNEYDEPQFVEAPDLPDEAVSAEPDAVALKPADRLARWQRKLLDLSLRNTLLNFRAAKKSIKLEAPDPGLLEDRLSEGLTLKILPKPDLMDGADPRSQLIYEGRQREDVRREHALDALKRREVFAAVAPDDLESRLVELFRAARTTLQEGGANTLYLALGFLSWRSEPNSDQKYRAPLILIPVSLSRKSARSGFTLTLHDDEPRFNPTLIEMLRQDFKLNLGIADGELPKDESGLDVTAIWSQVAHAIKDINGWEVVEDVVLAMFSFAKYLMWKDLVERTDQLRGNPVVRHLIDTPREPYASDTPFPDPRALDRELPPERMFCPLAADSSQIAAVIAASRGKDFVLVGPPGTGKSQTIANLIIQCLADGKRVLFVSEKIAALDVVYRRLREVKLADFCLELHSNKARKVDVLAQLQNAWDARGTADRETWFAEAQRLGDLRESLNVYVERLHHRHMNGMTIYEAIGCVVGGENLPAVNMSWPSDKSHSLRDLEAMRQIAERLDVNAGAIGVSTASAFAIVGQSEWSPSWQQSFSESLQQLVSTAHTAQQSCQRFVLAIGLTYTPYNRAQRAALVVLARALPTASGHRWHFVVRTDAHQTAERMQQAGVLLAEHRSLTSELSVPWAPEVIDGCHAGLRTLHNLRETRAQLGAPWGSDAVSLFKKGLALLAEIDGQAKQLSVRYDDRIEQLNVGQLYREWLKAEDAVWPVSSLGKKRVRGVLASAVVGEKEPDVSNDLRLLTRVRELRLDVAAIEMPPEVEGLWSGLKTRVEVAECAIKFQVALQAAREGMPWTDEGFEAIETGRCGEGLLRQLRQLRTIEALKRELNERLDLVQATAGLWAGLATDVERLELALRFQTAKQAIRYSGVLSESLVAIERGHCGAELARDAQLLRRRGNIERRIDEFADLRDCSEGIWKGLETQSEELNKALKFHESVSPALLALAVNTDQVRSTRQSLGALLGEGNALLNPQGKIAQAGHLYLKAWSTVSSSISNFVAAAGAVEPTKSQFEETPLEQILESAETLARQVNRLSGWCAWRKVRNEALVSGLAALVATIECGGVKRGEARRVFDVNYARWWLNATVNDDAVIRTFVSAEHEKRISDFRVLDERLTHLTRDFVRARLCADLPKQDSVSRSSEWGLLRHEMSKKKQHMPLRELMSQIPSALPKLTPCLLMSPLSIAQYLGTNAACFDLVVFDEASQIPVWDAIGAIARAKQVVMVGDPKQMPPTNFFGRAESETDDQDVEGDLESILDECIGANLPCMNLSWHYRSRSESLIAFSNHRYYQGSLVTFPSPVTEDRAVSFHPIIGVYEKGGARINKPEAKALVADLVCKLRSPEFRNSKLTIGVVTFNAEQQKLIEDLLDDERRKDPSLEPYFAETELEPVLVKNLESIQGDERDIMYFSVAYGPGAGDSTHVGMNFGPMNRSGGERRLNVAITRARRELRVFASFRPDQMDLTRTQAIGVRDLKHFLEFAERGSRALTESSPGSLGSYESPFEEGVAVALARKGWQLHTQVGVSAFRVDLAVVDPDAPGSYLAGIECDGATYHRSATARDRDKLRESVLRNLGWTIFRIWSTDWWIDAEGTLEKICAALSHALEQRRAKRAAEVKPVTIATGSVVEGAVIGDPDVDEAMPEPVPDDNDSPVTPAPRRRARPNSEVYARNFVEAKELSLPVFVMSNPRTVVERVDPDAFFERSYETTLGRMIDHVIEVEGPVLADVLGKRIARAHGWQRTGTRIQERVEKLAAKLHLRTRERVGTFFWHRTRGPDVPICFRRTSDDAPREVDEICTPELAALAQLVVSTGKQGDEAVGVLAQILGLQRVRAASRMRLERALAMVRQSPVANEAHLSD
jgi:very-short-patch-repair endonuclease/KaiC/GvpD/RAD55 family RecA-like ATPase